MAGDTHDPGGGRRARAARARGRARRAGARPLLRRPGAGGGARRRGRAGAGGGAGLARDRDRRSRRSSRRGRGWSGTSSASARRRARPSSPAPPTRRRRSGSARTSASSSTPRRRSRSWPGGRAADGVEARPLAAPPEQLAAARSAAFRLFDGFLRRSAQTNIGHDHLPSSALNWYGPRRGADRVRLRLLLVRVQGGLPPPLRGVLEPGQDAVLAGRRRRPGDRPPRGLPVLGHGGPAADRPAPQRRHLQPRPPQSRADRRARAGDGPLRHRQPPLPGAGPHRAGRGARRAPARRTCSA